ncbi:MAG TPA: ATPase domain-containing protein, partial [Ardenticatenaceae bacterium]|nr:ATPase domain-containing protein [Ardenticatenaceae bacterium]
MGTDDTIAPAGLIQRMPTHIWGLDAVLQGGLIQGATYLVTGPPGAGKSILANHLCFNHVAAGG